MGSSNRSSSRHLVVRTWRSRPWTRPPINAKLGSHPPNYEVKTLQARLCNNRSINNTTIQRLRHWRNLLWLPWSSNSNSHNPLNLIRVSSRFKVHPTVTILRREGLFLNMVAPLAPRMVRLAYTQPWHKEVSPWLVRSTSYRKLQQSNHRRMYHPLRSKKVQGSNRQAISYHLFSMVATS